MKLIPDCEIITEERGRIALEKIKSAFPDLIILDIQLPEMSGIEICQKLRKLDEFKTTPIIAVSALAMKGDKERIVAAGFNEYISKPIRINELRKTIQEYIEKLKG